MTALREPGLGPIIGHTTDTSSNIWIRGADPDDKGAYLHSNRRTVGVVALVEANGKPIANPQVYYFRLHRKYDRTGTFTLGEGECIKDGRTSQKLKPNTTYTARVGTLSIDDPFADDQNVESGVLSDRLPDANVWLDDLMALRDSRSVASFRTFAPASNEPGDLSFILGSCRYPGVLGKIKAADEIFGPLKKEADGDGAAGPARPTDFVLMVGDQIYADLLNRFIPIGLADTFEEFQERYLEAFGSRNMRRLLRNVPTYMVLDDHEIEDNWTQDRIGTQEKRRLFNFAIGAYMSYQWSHSPRTFQQRLYYFFECNGYPFFVLDTRTQRYMEDVRDNLSDNHLLGRPTIGGEEPSQLDRLLTWLVKQQQKRGNAPKFVVTASVFAPNPMGARTGRGDGNTSDETKAKWKEKSDSWPAFPETRRAILKCIIKNNIQNVVFLSGDIHCSNVAEMTFAGSDKAREIKAFSVTSSAFYWPFFFADGEPSNYVHDSKAKDQADTFQIDANHTMDYHAWNFTQEDNFCRLDLDKATHKLTITAMDSKGEIIRKKNWLGQAIGKPITTDFQLAPGW